MLNNRIRIFEIDRQIIDNLISKHSILTREFSIPRQYPLAKLLRLAFCFGSLTLIFITILFILSSHILFKVIFLILIVLISVLSAIDYFFYRMHAGAKHKQDLVNLRILLESETLADFYLNKNINKFSTYLEANNKNQKNSSSRKIRLTYPMVAIQKGFIERLISREKVYQKRLLDVGCGNGELAKLYANNGNFVFATELSMATLNKYFATTKRPCVISDVHRLPFKKETFDTINFTDLLEHLEDPKSALIEISQILKPGGLLIMTTPNSHATTLDTVSNPINPFVILEKIISLLYEKVLPERRLMQLFEEEDGGSVYVYHTTFTKRELIILLDNADFRMTHVSTYMFMNRGFARIFSILPLLFRERWVGFAVRTELFLARMPIIRLLGANWFICARKVSIETSMT